jgi:hypothetical protein
MPANTGRGKKSGQRKTQRITYTATQRRESKEQKNRSSSKVSAPECLFRAAFEGDQDAVVAASDSMRTTLPAVEFALFRSNG